MSRLQPVDGSGFSPEGNLLLFRAESETLTASTDQTQIGAKTREIPKRREIFPEPERVCQTCLTRSLHRVVS
ncbi:hypothetical protein AA3250_1392 [Gluconobacter albidus NBRC 3250]|nr:hypothetical protein AA3250_1392 [Gluconobacter albidus NBRC 3250]